MVRSRLQLVNYTRCDWNALRHPLILDGLKCLHVLSSFQRTGDLLMARTSARGASRPRSSPRLSSLGEPYNLTKRFLLLSIPSPPFFVVRPSGHATSFTMLHAPTNGWGIGEPWRIVCGRALSGRVTLGSINIRRASDRVNLCIFRVLRQSPRSPCSRVLEPTTRTIMAKTRPTVNHGRSCLTEVSPHADHDGLYARGSPALRSRLNG